jgi:hypothetical protein
VPDLVELPGIEPDTVGAALIDQYAGYFLEVFPVHDLPTTDTRHISPGILQTAASVLLSKGLFLVHRCFPRGTVEFRAIEPESSALGTEVIFLLVLRVDFEGFSASRTCGREEFSPIGQVGRTQRADPIDLVDLLTARSTCLGFVHLPFLLMVSRS